MFGRVPYTITGMSYIIRVESHAGVVTVDSEGEVPEGQHVIYGDGHDERAELVVQHRADDGRFSEALSATTDREV